MNRALVTLFIVLTLIPRWGHADPRDRFSPVKARHGMVVSAEPLAARAGLKVLERGGNAVDAAVTVGFVLAVTRPRAGNLAGGGFMLVHLAEAGETIAIDYRETAPAEAHRDMFLDTDGNVDEHLSRYSHRAAGVPGTVAGLALALEKYGTISLKEALAPAIRLAEEGFPASREMCAGIIEYSEYLRRWPVTRKTFFRADGSAHRPGDLFKQPDLARTLKILARDGAAGFYRGEVAALITAEMKRHGGLISAADLRAYRPVVREAVRGTYRGLDVHAMPPPSSGGVHLLQMLNIIERHDLGKAGHNSAAAIHVMAEAMRRAYADRSKHLGDPDVVTLPLDWLISKSYARQLYGTIDPARATTSKTVFPGTAPREESPDTTHFSVVDRHGNAVANTYTLNLPFGSCITVAGGGFLLNNEMDDFSASPNVPNYFGLVGGEANAISPGKRMLSSMVPVIVLRNGKPFLVTGSRGGSMIITTVLQVLLNVVDHGMNIQEAVNAPRIHHQWLPDELRIEEGFSPDTVRLLQAKGHEVVVKDAMGTAASIMVDSESGFLHGAADPRKEGLVAGY